MRIFRDVYMCAPLQSHQKNRHHGSTKNPAWMFCFSLDLPRMLSGAISLRQRSAKMWKRRVWSDVWGGPPLQKKKKKLCFPPEMKEIWWDLVGQILRDTLTHSQNYCRELTHTNTNKQKTNIHTCLEAKWPLTTLIGIWFGSGFRGLTFKNRGQP